MSEESTTPELVGLTREAVATGSSRDLDKLMSFYAPDAVWDLSPMGVGTFKGRAAIRSDLDIDEARAAAERLAEERR